MSTCRSPDVYSSLPLNSEETDNSRSAEDLTHKEWTRIMKSHSESSELLHRLSVLGSLSTNTSNVDFISLFDIMSNLNFVPLDMAQIENVERFVLFIGYPRSGHSIIGTMMDSHPNMVIANEFPLTRSLMSPALRNTVTKQGLFNALYLNSRAEMVYGERGEDGLERKGYLLTMNSSWQGNFSKLRIIGNKEGGATSKHYHAHPSEVISAYKWLQNEIGIPIHVLHVVRNPYDMVATHTLYVAGDNGHKYNASKTKKLNKPLLVEEVIKQFFFRAKAVASMIQVLNLTVLQLRHEDMVNKPKHTISQVCNFLQVDCSEDYLEACTAKTYRTVSKTRNLVMWTKHLRDRIDSGIKQFYFFNKYTFYS